VEDVPGLALDQVADHVVRHAAADDADHRAIDHDGLVEHQRHRVVETRSRCRQAARHRVAVRAVQELALQPGLHRLRRRGDRPLAAGMRRRQHLAGGVDE
jgi:hypothetical protein